MRVSIHAPVKGATFKIHEKKGDLSYVSIHAPVKGATGALFSPRCVALRFNPRARKGRDFCIVSGIILNASFNPRARKGRDVNI